MDGKGEVCVGVGMGVGVFRGTGQAAHAGREKTREEWKQGLSCPVLSCLVWAGLWVAPGS